MNENYLAVNKSCAFVFGKLGKNYGSSLNLGLLDNSSLDRLNLLGSCENNLYDNLISVGFGLLGCLDSFFGSLFDHGLLNGFGSRLFLYDESRLFDSFLGSFFYRRLLDNLFNSFLYCGLFDDFLNSLFNLGLLDNLFNSLLCCRLFDSLFDSNLLSKLFNSRLLDSLFNYGLLDSLFNHGLLNSLFNHGLLNSLFNYGLLNSLFNYGLLDGLFNYGLLDGLFNYGLLCHRLYDSGNVLVLYIHNNVYRGFGLGKDGCGCYNGYFYHMVYNLNGRNNNSFGFGYYRLDFLRLSDLYGLYYRLCLYRLKLRCLVIKYLDSLKLGYSRTSYGGLFNSYNSLGCSGLYLSCLLLSSSNYGSFAQYGCEHRCYKLRSFCHNRRCIASRDNNGSRHTRGYHRLRSRYNYRLSRCRLSYGLGDGRYSLSYGSCNRLGNGRYSLSYGSCNRLGNRCRYGLFCYTCSYRRCTLLLLSLRLVGLSGSFRNDCNGLCRYLVGCYLGYNSLGNRFDCDSRCFANLDVRGLLGSILNCRDAKCRRGSCLLGYRYGLGYGELMSKLSGLILKLANLRLLRLKSNGFVAGPLKLLEVVIKINVGNGYVSLNLLALAKLSCKEHKCYKKRDTKNCCDNNQSCVVKLEGGLRSILSAVFTAVATVATVTTVTAGATGCVITDGTLAVFDGVSFSITYNSARALECVAKVVDIVACVIIVGVSGNILVITNGTLVIYKRVSFNCRRVRAIRAAVPVSVVVELVFTVGVVEHRILIYSGVLLTADALTGLGAVGLAGCITVGYVVLKRMRYSLANGTARALRCVAVVVNVVACAKVVDMSGNVLVITDRTLVVYEHVRLYYCRVRAV